MANTKKTWTSSEDQYLMLALEQGLSATQVARNLGRSPLSITARKTSQGLKGRFKRATFQEVESIRLTNSKTGKKKSPKNIKPSDSPSTSIFELETGLEIPFRFSRLAEEKVKLAATFEQMKVGQSFVINSDLVNSARLLAKTTFESYKVRIIHTSSDKKFARVHRIL